MDKAPKRPKAPIRRVHGLFAEDDGTEGWDTCPLCGGDWLKCGCDPAEADAAYTEGDAP